MWREYLERRSASEPAMTPDFRGTPLFLALMLWVCTLPLVIIIALPFLGWKITAYIAGFILVADLAACWFLCIFHIQRMAATSCEGRLRNDR